MITIFTFTWLRQAETTETTWDFAKNNIYELENINSIVCLLVLSYQKEENNLSAWVVFDFQYILSCLYYDVFPSKLFPLMIFMSIKLVTQPSPKVLSGHEKREGKTTHEHIKTPRPMLKQKHKQHNRKIAIS